MLISGFQKSSFIDYPNKISAIVFTQGCNFKCPYCHNPELNQLKTCETEFSVSQVLSFLNERKGKLDGVVITGGEPSLQNDLTDFIVEIKKMGFLVKLDSNGTNPNLLIDLYNKKLVDYIAMDIKAPLEKYNFVTDAKVNIENIKNSIDFLINSNIDYEFRTTVIKSQLNIEDFVKIAALISGCKRYYLQKFLPTKTLSAEFLDEKTYTDEEFIPIINELKKHINIVELR